jgi:hypothetical protein
MQLMKFLGPLEPSALVDSSNVTLKKYKEKSLPP